MAAAGVLTDRGLRRRWVCVPFFVAAAATVSSAGKMMTRRPRPSLSSGSPPIGRLGLASSFPSTHAACAFAIAGWMQPTHRRFWLLMLATAIGYARIRSRAHYLSDVVVGGTLGYAMGRSANWIGGTLLAAVHGLRRDAYRQGLCESQRTSQLAARRVAVFGGGARKRKAKMLLAIALIGVLTGGLRSAVAYAERQAGSTSCHVARAALPNELKLRAMA